MEHFQQQNISSIVAIETINIWLWAKVWISECVYWVEKQNNLDFKYISDFTVSF